MPTSLDAGAVADARRADAEAVWKDAAGSLRDRISSGHFTAWFATATAVGIRDGALILRVPSPWTKDWIESRYMPALRDAVAEAGGPGLGVVLEATAEPAADEQIVLEEEPAPATEPLPPVVGSPPVFHPKYNFDSFVIGSSNRFAHAAALAVAEAPAQAYNPLFIYGGAGLGKTHLLHAIGHYVSQFHVNLSVRYVSTEQFLNDFVIALQRRTIPEFHRVYRAVDLLLIDDIQFIEGKERLQEEFFHTFNALHPHSQLVLTSDRPPKKIATLEERLRTRFEWGLITDIQPPDLETRLAILQKKAETEGLAMPGDVLSYIAGRIQTNIRELEGALIRVAAYASLTRSTVTLDLAKQVLQSLLPNSAEAPVTVDLVLSVAASYYDVSLEQITSANRSRSLVTARQMVMYLCRELTDLSLPQIGKRLGNRDHSTVIYAVNKVREQIAERESSYQQVQELTSRIRQRAVRG